MSDLETSAEKRTTAETIQQYYDRALNYALEQNKKLSKVATDTNVAGGYVETYYSRGIWRKDFATPLAQTLTAEDMANDGYFSLILNTFSALCGQVKTELSYKSKELLNNPLHKKIFDFIEMQLDTMGGYDTLFEKVIKPSLRWGTGIGLPTMKEISWGGKKYAGLTDMRTVNLQNVMQFFFEDDNTTRLSEIRYLTYPKIITTELSNSVDVDSISNSETTEVNIKTINCRYNATAITSHDTVDGNPLGLPYLYFLYPIWKTYKAMLEGTYNSMISFGQYPLGVRRTGKESGIDALAWENNVKSQLEEIIALGGAPFVSSEGEMYTLEPPDTQKLLDAQKSIFDIASRASGLGQITFGIDGGGSKNLTESIDALTDKHVKATVKKALADISDTFILNLIKINFASEYNKGQILEFPALRVKDIEENNILTNTVKEGEEKSQNKTQNKNLKVKQDKNSSIIIDDITQTSAKTTFNILKNEPEGIEKEIIIDSKHLDDFLSSKIDEFASELGIILKPKLKEAVEKIVENPRKQLNVWGMFDKAKFEKDIKQALERIVKDSAIEEAQYIAAAFRLGNTTFEEKMKTDVYTYASKIADKYIKSNAFKDIVNATMLDVESLIRDYATKQNTSFVLSDKSQTNQIVKTLQDRVENLKGQDFYNLAKNTTLKTFTNVSDYENRETLKKVDDYAVLRSGILEGQCAHCEARMGDIYYRNDSDNLVNDSGEVLVLPDPKCFGTLGGNTCRCWSILVPSISASVKEDSSLLSMTGE